MTALLQRFLQPFLIAALVAALAGVAVLQWQKMSLQRELAEERQVWAEAVAEAEARAREIERGAVDVQTNERIQHAEDLAAADGRLRAALERLRNEAQRAALKPAAAAPAECGSYEASPTQLSVQSREFLVREADRADRVVLQLEACQREYQGTVDVVNGVVVEREPGPQ